MANGKGKGRREKEKEKYGKTARLGSAGICAARA
jgi:hypothetical protein